MNLNTQMSVSRKCVSLLLFFTSLISCRSSQAISSAPAQTMNEKILGAWNLKTVAGITPDKFNIKSWQAEFFAGGKWDFSGSMSGPYEGMQLKGSGTYQISGNEFHYTAGDRSGKSLIEVKDGLLMLSPDPVVKPNGGKDDVTTEYERAK